ncbi:MAG: stage II sporulation protein R [Roseburia sp.]|nr:stage II sporulation protein R [Ruminococcus sp.]MCM1156228.1 stage II sporulation protein R [Roseburia sp.]MCM1243033.1 stage II sporulation protein R [Roseburia sp.]
MKEIKKATLRNIKTAVMSIAAGAAAFVWWGVLYPELCFPQDTYEVMWEEAEITADGGEIFSELSEEEICERLLQAEEEQVIVKSRLLEWIGQQLKR